MCEFSNSAIKTEAQFKSRYKALVIRRGHKRSIIATGHKILEVIYHILKNKVPYKDPGVDYEKLMVEKNAPRWLQALARYGYLKKAS